MNTETITYNELIARFHGWRYSPTPKGKGAGLWYFPEWNKAAFKSDAFEYHTSWEWLMPVVEKIAGMNEFSTSIERYGVISLSIASSIEVVYKAVVQFIHWYNSVKK